MKGFREFIMRGNVVELAVAVIIGAAFTSIVNSLVDGIFNPIIAAIFNADEINKAVLEVFRAQNIAIPFPQREVRMVQTT